ncbi:hypothetical protein BGW36DRAFT_380976 [Talaromyces proteolyticus]|uniref:Uncharacterized protein n=1 Tax=Talaromyces proteolyticus TaxID=1131652 RepID=A0AAD4KPN2_9EURO|nr:hypothetical protein BGW36DRAFT_380976 [Talaromyces proteolyticus]
MQLRAEKTGDREDIDHNIQYERALTGRRKKPFDGRQRHNIRGRHKCSRACCLPITEDATPRHCKSASGKTTVNDLKFIIEEYTLLILSRSITAYSEPSDTSV